MTKLHEKILCVKNKRTIILDLCIEEVVNLE